MHLQWLTTEHNRLHVVEEWPDGPHKEAALSAIRSSLASLARSLPPDVNLQFCEVCLGRKQAPGIIQFPLESSPIGAGTTPNHLAA